MTIAVERFAGDPEEWDRFVLTEPAATHFHRFAWSEVMRRGLGHQTVWLAARAAGDGRLAGVLPLVRVKSVIFGHYLVSMPFVNYGGPLGDPAVARALVEEAVRLARGDRVRLLELRNRYPLDIPLAASHRKITVTLDLPSTEGALWSQLPSKVRSQVRRPEKEGVTVAFGADRVGAFYQVFSTHMRDLGTPVMPRRFFELLPEIFGESVWFAVALHGDRPIAAGAGFRWGEEFEITWAASLREWSRTAPNMALYWAFMKRCVADGARRFNFGRCTPGSGTHRFKQQWGGVDEQLWWYQDSPDSKSVTKPLSPDRGLLAVGARVWSHLPLSVANVIGPRIVRFIP